MTTGTRADDTHRADASPDSTAPRGGTRRRAVIVAGLAVLLLVAALAAAFPGQIKHQLQLSLARQPTPYTQLYFTAPAAIPSSLQAGQKNTVDFTIENDEGHAYRYTYVVTLKDAHSTQQAGKESLTVNSGQHVTRAVTVVPKDRNTRYLIKISLPTLNQAIQFYGKTS